MPLLTAPGPAGSGGFYTWMEQVRSKLNNWVDVEADFGAVPDEIFFDGVSNTSTTFTSATAVFTAADVGKTIVILRAGPSNYQDHHTTIAGFTNASTVTLTHATQRSQTSCRFYLSRAGDQTAAIQAAIDACATQGGGMVAARGVGYLVSGLVLKNRVGLAGAGKRATMIHLIANANAPVIRNDTTTDNSAQHCAIRDLWVDGNRARQSNITSTLNGAYTAGNTSITLTDASAFFNGGGAVTIGSNRLIYSTKSGNVLSGLVGGVEGTTDANASNGATVTQIKAVGIHLGLDPFNTVPATAEYFDPHHLIENVYVKNTKGDGVQLWGQSETRVENVVSHLSDEIGFRPSFDSWLVNCTADTSGRMGYLLRWSEQKLLGCKAFYCGGVVAADGYGFLLEGPTTLEEGTKILASCGAQDNKADGFRLRNAQRCIMQVTASSNGTSSAGAYVGVRLDGVASLNVIDAVCTERVASPNNTQQSAMSIESGCVSNQIRITHGLTAGSTVGAAIKSGSDLSGGNDLRINGMGGTITPAFASSYTPDPYLATVVRMTLTGNITINAPSNAHLGCELEFHLTQDATAGRTTTFNGAFKTSWTPTTTNGRTNIIRFRYNGTNWMQVGSVVGLV